jgi:glyoxylase I family protein
MGGCMNPARPNQAQASSASPPATSETDARRNPPASPQDFATVRYQVADVERSLAFYAKYLEFKVEQNTAPAFASVLSGHLRLLLSGPGSSGSRIMPDGRRQEPGGWNRIVLYVDDLARHIEALQTAGTRFRNQVEVGPGGKQIQIEDPDGNPIELHEAPKSASK